MTLKEKQRIHHQMTIDSIFSSFPHRSQRLGQEMTNFGLHCVGCSASTWETLEAGMLGHGMEIDQVDELVEKLNAILDLEIDTSKISMTERAVKKYLVILEEEGKQGWGLRFGEKLGGCNGWEYQLDYAKEPEPRTDEIYESFGLQIFVNKDVLPRLKGCEIDHVEGLYGAGFKISNPNASSSCSCGTSHNY